MMAFGLQKSCRSIHGESRGLYSILNRCSILEAWYSTAHILTAKTLCRIPPENMKQKAQHVGCQSKLAVHPLTFS